MTIYGKESFTKIVTVLRSGGDYQRIHVEKIRGMVERYVSEFEFICLTDSPTEEYDRPLKHDWPGWWAKMEIFNIPGPVLFLDLDTIIVDNIDCIIKSLKDQPFVTLRDNFGAANRTVQMSGIGSDIGSGIMSWSEDVAYLYHSFLKDSEKFMSELRGDQDFIQREAKENTFIQDYSKGVVSFKADILDGWLYNPPFHKIVFFHGEPRPWQQEVIPY